MNNKYLSIFCIFFLYEAINAFDIKPSRATLESNVGEMQVEMKMLADGTWKLTSILDGGSIVRREESEVFKLIDNQIHPINYRFNQRILFRKYKASADFDWQDNEVSFVENKDKGGLYLSNDGGQSWKLINNERKLRQRAWYYTRVYADTQDENLVYVLNVRYHKSTDSGKSFKTYNAPHGDHHDLWISPEDPKRMIIGDDGGAQVSYDRGESWSTYMNQPTSQFYRVTTDNSFPYRIYAAQQDNSTIRINHRSSNGSITESDWEPTAGGESAHIAVDPLNNEVIYGGSYDGFLTRVNHESGSVRAINVWPDNPMGHGAEGMKYRFQWNFPIIFSKHNPKKLYTFSNQVHVTENEGQSWDIISPDLTRNDPNKLKSSGGPITQDNTSVEYYCTIFAAQESPLKEGLIWVVSDDGLVHLTKNTW